jgi:NADPH2:quinone reductase
MGARVIAAASSAAKLAAAKDHGADEVIDYALEDLTARAKELTAGKGVDVIYDPVGGAFTEAAFRAIAPGGRHMVIGFAAGEIPRLPLNLPLLKRASVVGVFWGAWAGSDPAGQAANMAELFALYERGAIKPHVAASYSLAAFRDAFAELAGRRAIGKVVFTP